MMDTRKQEISASVSRFLNRHEVPRNLQGDDMSKHRLDAQAALVRGVAKMLPERGHLEALERIFAVVEANAKTRFWPTLFEFNRAARDVGASSGIVAPKLNLDEVQINKKRMEAREGVGEEWLFGKKSARLLRAGVSKQLLDEYRQSTYQSRAEIYGDEAADAWAIDAKSYHAAQLAEEGEERRQYATGQMMPKVRKMPIVDWGLA